MENNDKTFKESKKVKFGLIGIISIVGVGILSISLGGVATSTVLPLVLDGIKTIVLGYLLAQGSNDAIKLFKNNKDKIQEDSKKNQINIT